MDKRKERFDPVDVLIFIWIGLYLAHRNGEWVAVGFGLTLAVAFIALYHDIRKPSKKDRTPHD